MQMETQGLELLLMKSNYKVLIKFDVEMHCKLPEQQKDSSIKTKAEPLPVGQTIYRSRKDKSGIPAGRVR